MYQPVAFDRYRYCCSWDPPDCWDALDPSALALAEAAAADESSLGEGSGSAIGGGSNQPEGPLTEQLSRYSWASFQNCSKWGEVSVCVCRTGWIWIKRGGGGVLSACRTRKPEQPLRMHPPTRHTYPSIIVLTITYFKDLTCVCPGSIGDPQAATAHLPSPPFRTQSAPNSTQSGISTPPPPRFPPTPPFPTPMRNQKLKIAGG